jgi:L-2-hydroxyglutarate oxidase LhgO
MLAVPLRHPLRTVGGHDSTAARARSRRRQSGVDHIDVLVVGAGVVGLAAARALALGGREVLVLEREGAIGQGVSSRNSEVVHAGLYYPAGSLKARLCVQGRGMLYAYCAERGVAHRRCGKLLVATAPAQHARLDAIAAAAAANGVHDLRRLTAAEVKALEPALHCTAALLSPATGIIDSHGLMTTLLGDAQNAGALLALRSPFVGARRDGRRWVVRTGGDEACELAATWIVNAAGIGAQRVAHAMHGFARERIAPQRLAKGHYFALAGRAPFSHLVYPTPVDGGLGVHLTLDLGGQARFGPDVEWLREGIGEDEIDYTVDAGRRAAFEADIRRYWPALPEGALQPAYTGVRPKIGAPGEPAADFVVAGPRDHGCAGTVQLFGIESPGLTSALAIGELVARIVVDAPPS